MPQKHEALSWRRRVHDVLESGIGGDRLGTFVNLALVLLICLNVAAFAIETVPAIGEPYARWFQLFDWFSIGIFTVEYGLRLWSSIEQPILSHMPSWRARLAYAARPMSIIDLLAFLPGYLAMFLPGDFAVLRVLRLFRFLKIARYSSALHSLGRVIADERGPLFGTLVIMLSFVLVKDITVGIANTGIKAAVIKCATDRPGITPGVERVLRACAQAHRRTGAPITTHTTAALHRGLEQQAIFREEGVDLSRVVIGHSGDTDDFDYLLKLIDNGSILGMDRFGIDGYLPTARRVEVIAELCQRGYADRMVLSHDASCYLDWIPGEIPPSTMPHWHYLHISTDVLPMLREAGVAEAQIDTMLTDTPRRFFENNAVY